MKRYCITKIDIPVYPILRLTFDDGLMGELDMRGNIQRAALFAPLRDEAFFHQVKLGEDGRSFGWRLDQLGSEIDLGADAARADIETALVVARAEKFKARMSHAAE
ncbi:MAG: molybdopterin-guanine dinucleotide biosynthesis protein [Beijerinckiaceae bacterium]